MALPASGRSSTRPMLGRSPQRSCSRSRPWRPRGPKRRGSRAGTGTRSRPRRRRSSWRVGAPLLGRSANSLPGVAAPASPRRSLCRRPHGHSRCRCAGTVRARPSCGPRSAAAYEAALALGDTDDDDLLRKALDELRAMGAAPAAAIVARRLRRRGARGVSRGPRPSTRQNPANLTPRELDVLKLVAEGLRSAEIADRLFLSRKTVDHHVSAILRKLGVRTRGEASAEARRLGLAGKDG